MIHFAILLLVVSVINAQVSQDTLCEGRVFAPSCAVGTLRIAEAFYGKSDSWFCGGPDRRSWMTNCSTDVTQYLRTACQGRTSCVVPIEGQDVCAGNAKYLRVGWSCDSGFTQSRNNNRNTNILLSSSAQLTNPQPLHGQVVSGSSLFVFLDPPRSISQVRWYLDNTDRVFTVETAAPWELLGGRSWDTVASRVSNGPHRIIAAITFTDKTSGHVDAMFNVLNQVQARAVERISTAFLENSTAPSETVVIPHTLPWALFGTSAGIVVILIVVLIVMSNKSKPLTERA